MSSAASEMLRAVGLRRTPARIAILASIECLGCPLTHGELRALPALAEVDAITLYRTLSALEGAGLVHGVPGLDGTWRYCAQPRDRDGCPGNHAHFLCTSCGSMTCLLSQAMPRTEVPSGSEVHGRHFLVHGRCATCVAGRRTHPGRGVAS